MFRTLLNLGLAIFFLFAGRGLLKRNTDGLYGYNSCLVPLCLAWLQSRNPMGAVVGEHPLHYLERNALLVISILFVVGALFLNRKIIRWDLKESTAFKKESTVRPDRGERRSN